MDANHSPQAVESPTEHTSDPEPACRQKGLVDVETSTAANGSSSPSSTVQHDKEGETSVSSPSDHHSSDTSPTEVSCQEDAVSFLQARCYSSPAIQSSLSDDLGRLRQTEKASRSAPLSPTFGAKLKAELTLPRKHIDECHLTDDSIPELLPSNQTEHSLAAAQLHSRIAQRRFGNEKWLLEPTTESRDRELERIREEHAREIEKARSEYKDGLAKVNDQLQHALSQKYEALKRLDVVEQQLSITQGELEVKDSELKQAKADCQSQHSGSLGPVKRLQLQPGGFGMKSASPAYKSRMRSNSSIEQSETIAKLRSQLQHQAAEMVREKARADDLVKERDEARWNQDSMSKELSTLKLEWESEYNKCKILRHHLQDDPAKTEPLDNQLKLKDEAYKTLEKIFGDCLAENAELRSKISHVQETADWKVFSLEKQLEKKKEFIFDIARSRDSYFQSHSNVLALRKGTITDQAWAARLDEQWKIVVEENRVLRLHLKTSTDRETQLAQEVLFEKSKVGSAQQETRKKADKISELEYEKHHTDRELECFKLQILEHNDLIAAKDVEVKNANKNTRIEVGKMMAMLEATIEKGTVAILQEKQEDLNQLQNCFSQVSQENVELRQQINVLENTHRWDTDAARRATQAHEANTSRMVAAEGQVAQLIKKLSNGEHANNERLWNQWRECDSSRIQARRAFEKATSRLDDFRTLGMDLYRYISTIGQSFGLQLNPGSELADHHQRLMCRAVELLQPTEFESQLPVAVYVQPIFEADKGSEVVDNQYQGVEAPITPIDTPPTPFLNTNQLTAGTPSTCATRLIGEKENDSGIPLENDSTTSTEDDSVRVDQNKYFMELAKTRGESSSLDREVGAIEKSGPAQVVPPGRSHCNATVYDAPRTHPTFNTPRSPLDIDTAMAKLRRNLDQLAQTAHSHKEETIKTRAIPRVPPGLDGAGSKLTQNLERLAQIVPVYEDKSSETKAIPVISPALAAAKDYLRQNLEKLAQTVPDYGDEATENAIAEKDVLQRDSSYLKAVASPEGSLLSDSGWECTEPLIDAYRVKLENQPSTPELERAYTSADSGRLDSATKQIIADNMALVKSQSLEDHHQPSDPELGQLYLGSDVHGSNDAGDQGINHGMQLTLFRPSIVVDVVLGPGEEWDDDDDVEIIC